MSNLISGRLPAGVRPQSYTLDLFVQLAEKTFSGRLLISLKVEKSLQTITLHALGLIVTETQLCGQEALVSIHPSDETMTLTFPETIPPGEQQLSLAFSGKLNQQMRGLYATEVQGETFAFTQFEATDTRRMFPCFDEPAIKARFKVSLNVPTHLTALSNMPIVEEKKVGNLKKITFDETPLMSTYLLAVAIARLEKREIRVGETAVAVWTLAEQVPLGSFALKVTQAVLPLLNDYFDLPCPTPKLDLVCVPDFAMGAMENWGAIFFRDACLLLDENRSSTATQRRVADVITHEIVHQWFGNLVTMHWWDDLWLNESFATWLACKIVDQWRPEWDSWLSFQEGKAVPLALDALENSRAIQADVKNAAEIEEMFDALTYEKGGACLRMIEIFLGESVFREGIRRYIKQFQYQNASADDLWTTLERSSGQPLKKIAKDWFTRPGFPLIKIETSSDKLKTLHLSQQRFTGKKIGRDLNPWIIPMALKYEDDEGIHEQHILMDKQEMDLTLPVQGSLKWIYGNASEAGFYRIAYEGRPAKALSEFAAKALHPIEKIGYLGDLWALSYRGDHPISVFMEALCHFRGDASRVLVSEICSYLEILSSQIVLPADHSRFAAFVDQQLTPLWKKCGWDADKDEDDEKRLVRADLLWALGSIAQDEEILSELPRRQTLYQARPHSIDASLVGTLIRLCALSDGGKRFDQFIEKLERSKTPEQRDYYLLALATFNKPALACKLIELCLSNKIRAQDIWKPIRTLLSNPVVQGTSWTYIKQHWTALHTKGGSLAAQRIIQSTAQLWSEDWHADISDFFKNPDIRPGVAVRTLAQTLEFIQLGMQFKKYQTSELSNWLQDNAPAGVKKVF